MKAPPPVASTCGPLLEQPRDHPRLAGAEIGLAVLARKFPGWSCRRRFSISVSASTNGMPSRAASRRPTDDLPAPIMPTSTIERAAQRAHDARCPGSPAGGFCTAPLYHASDFRHRVHGSIYQQSRQRAMAALPAAHGTWSLTPAGAIWSVAHALPDAVSHAEPVPIPDVRRRCSAASPMARVFSLANFVRSQPREITVTIPPDKFVKQPSSGRHADGPRRDAIRRRRSIELVPRHAGGRARRRRQHARRLSPRSRRSRRAISRAHGSSIADADTDDLRGYLADLDRARLHGLVAGAAAVGDAPALSLPLCRGQRGDDPAAVLEGPKRGRALPKVLSIAEVDALLGRRSGRPKTRRNAAQRGCARRGCSACWRSLRHGPARLRAGGAAGGGGAARPAHAGGARQGRQGAAGAAQRRGQGAPWPTIWRCAHEAGRDGEVQMAVPVVRRAAAISPASISPAN